MASGLPILCSKRCGAASDLVKNGINGFQFDPEDPQAISSSLQALTNDEARIVAMGQMSGEIIAHWGLGRFVQSLSQAAEAAISKHCTPSPVGRLAAAVAARF